MTLTIWHNPRCSKSRQTLALLTENGQSPDIVKYLDAGPNADQIRAVLSALNIPAIELMHTGEKVFKELGLSKTDTDETLIAAMVANPILIERPVVINGGRAAIGRPPEGVLDIL
jgi:arsenate reductase